MVYVNVSFCFQLGSYDLLLLESFQTDVLDAIRKIPIQLYQRTSFSKNEIFVDLIDRCIVMVRAECVIASILKLVWWYPVHGVCMTLPHHLAWVLLVGIPW